MNANKSGCNGVRRKLILLSIFILFFFLSVLVINFIHSTRKLNREVLDDSYRLGREFLLNNQKPAGNFNYEYDFIKKKQSYIDSEVRQAGALWGISLIHLDTPTTQTKRALLKGFDFFEKKSNYTKDSLSRYIIYSGSNGKTGTMALASLALIEYLQVQPNDSNAIKLLDDYIRFLLSLRTDSGFFYQKYRSPLGRGHGGHSPYFDGETLLALSKAANYLGYDYLKDTIVSSAEAMYQKYVVDALDKNMDSDETKGFYQWGSMAFYEIYKAGWGNHFADYVIDMAYWMINVHRTYWRRKNTSYAQEGIITAYHIAEETGNKKAQRRFGYIIDRVLFKLTSWQIGSKIQNQYLSERNITDSIAKGGIMNFNNDTSLRIDVAQHQMHAVILARKWVYKK